MWATASTALRLQRSAALSADVLAPAADMATVAVVPGTRERGRVSGVPHTITSQRLTHALYRTAAVADHRHIGVVHSETFRAAGGDEILARGRHQHAFLPESRHIGAHLHG